MLGGHGDRSCACWLLESPLSRIDMLGTRRCRQTLFYLYHLRSTLEPKHRVLEEKGFFSNLAGWFLAATNRGGTDYTALG